MTTDTALGPEEIKIAYWDCDDSSEILHHEEMDEAIEAHLDDIDPENTPETIEVFGYRRGIVNAKKFTAHVLEAANEYLSETHDGEDGHEQCSKIEEAAALFVKTYIENYTPWGCEIVKTETVNTKEWISKNRPNWFSENERLSNQ